MAIPPISLGIELCFPLKIAEAKLSDSEQDQLITPSLNISTHQKQMFLTKAGFYMD